MTAEVAKKCGIENALVDRPDPQQEETKQKARDVLSRTRMPNEWSAEENAAIAVKMQEVLDEPTRMTKQLDPLKQKQYDFLLEKRIRQAVKTGEIPNPSNDPDFRKMLKLHQK